MNAAVIAENRIAQIVEAFENSTIDPGIFDHEAHILVGWRYLQHYSLPNAITRFTCALRRLTRKLGVPTKYHETITWFYLLQIAERRADETVPDWAAFKAANADLFEKNPSLIQKYYSKSLLSSDTARRLFVFPDLQP